MNEVAQSRRRDPDSLPAGVQQTTIPGSVQEIIDEYDETVGTRDRFLWKWLYHVFPEIRLSCVPEEAGRTVREGKLLASLFVVLLDDVAEVEGDRQTFQEISKVPFPHRTPDITRSGVDSETVELAARIWECVETLMRSGERTALYRDLLRFDLRQTITAIQYSFLTNEHLEIAGVEETTIYDTHNMMLLTYADIDLLYGRGFDDSELATLREVLRRAQEMARIGNWVTTWKRELREGDFSSGVVVAALEDGVVSRAVLERVHDGSADLEAVESRIEAARIEERFLRRWYELYREIERYEFELETVDVESFLDGMEAVLDCHLTSRGFK